MTNKTALITGGASGIGKASAFAFANAEANIFRSHTMEHKVNLRR
jgi:NAD(P)-dependent dehydrogenase (short-subunit alcohol dehydrogenase family)